MTTDLEQSRKNLGVAASPPGHDPFGAQPPSASSCQHRVPNAVTFTPGPWSLFGSEDGTTIYAYAAPGTLENICHIRRAPKASEAIRAREAANSHLIRAAPGMFAALRSLFDRDNRIEGNRIIIECDTHGHAILVAAEAREAISLALGDPR